MLMSKRSWLRGFKLNIHAPGTGFLLILLALNPFQPLNVETGALHWVHFEEVNGIVPSRKSS